MKTLFLLFAAINLMAITSCKKDNDENSPAEETKQKILGRWEIKSIIIKESFSGEDHVTTHAGTSADYVDFKSNGKMDTYFKNNLNVSDYSVKSVKIITIEGDDHTVRELTDSTLVMYSTDRTGSIGYTEITYDLER
jgi:hypothetical protein